MAVREVIVTTHPQTQEVTLSGLALATAAEAAAGVIDTKAVTPASLGGVLAALGHNLRVDAQVQYNLRQGSGPYTVHVGDDMAWFNTDGSFFLGQNHLANYSSNDLGQMHPDFLWDARALRLSVRNLTMQMVADPCDLNMRRWGPDSNAFPYLAGGTGDGTFASLTGLAADSNVAQLRSTPAAVPYGVGNDQNTIGAQAQETNAIITFSTDDMPRRVTNDGLASVAGKIEIALAPKNAHDFRETYFQIKSEGRVYIGNKAVSEGNTAALVNIRVHEGDNVRHSIATSGTPTGGTFKIIFWEPPQSDTTFSLGATTGTIAYNASAATIQTAIVTAMNGLAGNVPGTATAWSAVTNAEVTVGGGPLPTAVTVEFTGVLAKTRIQRMGLTDKAFTGGSSPNVAVTRLNQNGIGSQAALHILRLTGCTGLTGDYLRIVDVAGTTQMNFTSAGKLFLNGEIEIDGALNHDGTTVGFYGIAPVTRPTAYTQTYNTADKTHAAPTATALTDNTTGTANTTLQAIPDPADSPGTADALRDDIVANDLPAIRNNFADLAASNNALIADLADVKQLVNSVIDDLQALGLVQ